METAKKNKSVLVAVGAAILAVVSMIVGIIILPVSKPEEIELVATKTHTEELLEQMTLEEKCAQLFIVRQSAMDKNVGGVILFGDDINNPEQLKKLVNEIKTNIKIAPFIAVDEEGGIVSRVGNNTNFQVKKIPAANEIGKTEDVEIAEKAADTIANYLKEYGFNVDFAPVADVNSNPENTVIGTRAFGSDPEKVAEMVAAQVRVFSDAGIISSAKHFPGHGDTTEDTHIGTAVVNKNLDELNETELVPFRAAIEAGVPMIMAAHITVPNIDNSGMPASLSEIMLTEILRGELGFEGIIITDSMEMGAITNRFNSGEAAIKALKAGADIILLPTNYNEAKDAAIKAVQSGEIDENIINEKVLRILNLKEKFSII